MKFTLECCDEFPSCRWNGRRQRVFPRYQEADIGFMARIWQSDSPPARITKVVPRFLPVLLEDGFIFFIKGETSCW